MGRESAFGRKTSRAIQINSWRFITTVRMSDRRNLWRCGSAGTGKGKSDPLRKTDCDAKKVCLIIVMSNCQESTEQCRRSIEEQPISYRRCTVQASCRSLRSVCLYKTDSYVRECTRTTRWTWVRSMQTSTQHREPPSIHSLHIDSFSSGFGRDSILVSRIRIPW